MMPDISCGICNVYVNSIHTYMLAHEASGKMCNLFESNIMLVIQAIKCLRPASRSNISVLSGEARCTNIMS